MIAQKSTEKITDSSLTDLNWLQTADEEENHAEKKKAVEIKELVALLPATGVHPPRSRGNQEGRPQLSFAGLISLAIGSTKNGGLTLSGIYEWIEEAFPFFKSEKAKAWKNSVRHNLSVRKSMFEKMLGDGQSKRSRAAVWLLKNPEGLREYEKAFATLPSIAAKTINRSFVNSTLSQRSFESGMTKKPSAPKEACTSLSAKQAITQQARSFLSRYASSDKLMVDPMYACENEDSENTLSASEDETKCNIIRKRPASSVYILKKRKSFGSLPSRSTSVCYDITNKPLGSLSNGALTRCPPGFESFVTPPKTRAVETVASPTLFQLFAAQNKCPSPEFNLFASPLTPLKGMGGLEMDSGINITPIRNDMFSTCPVTALSPGLIPPLSNSTPQATSYSSCNYDSGVNLTSDNTLNSHVVTGMRRELF
jgi:hypothetical protein